MMERTLERNSWFWEPAPESVRRAVWVGVVWAYVAGLAASMLMALAAGVALAANGIIYLADYGRRTFETTDVLSAVSLVFWIVVPLAFGLSVWSATYASTTSQSVARGAVAIAAGALLGLLFHLSGFSGAALAGLGLGWAIAVPAEHPTRWAVRAALPVLVGAMIFPRWDGLSLQIVVLVLAITPALAGLFVWLSDVAYQGLVTSRQERDTAGAVGRTPTSID